MPIGVPVAGLVVVWLVVPAAVAASLCTRPLIAPSPVLIVTTAWRALCLPVVSMYSWAARPWRAAGNLLTLVLGDCPLLAWPLVGVICSSGEDAIAYVPDDDNKERLGKYDTHACLKVQCCLHVVEI